MLTLGSEPLTTRQPARISPYWRPPGPSVATRIPSRRSRFSSRSSIVGGAEPRRIYCEGGLEEKAAYVFTTHRDVADVREQPAPVRFIDQDGKSCRHIFDFLLMMKRGRKIAVQIKPAKFEAKWRPIIQLIARQMSARFADEAVLITERELHADLVHNAMLIHAVRRDPPGEEDRQMQELVSNLRGTVLIGHLVAHSGLEGRGFRSIVRLIADGELDIEGGRIGYGTKISRPERLASR
jgi:hypothetical protein